MTPKFRSAALCAAVVAAVALAADGPAEGERGFRCKRPLTGVK
ncbi:MAG: hypothetical protein ACRC33_03595 [Gemmataceae bacterium]